MFGDLTSAITAKHIEGHLDGLTVDEVTLNAPPLSSSFSLCVGLRDEDVAFFCLICTEVQVLTFPSYSNVQAVSKQRLFVADYHDAYLPFVERINAQKDSKTYATRALFFLSSDETLKVLALELVLPPKTPGETKISKVVTPPADASKIDYYWECAKAHVLNNDIVAHQVFSHL